MKAPQDTTFLNVRATKKREAALLKKIEKLEAANRGSVMWFKQINQRLAKLEQR